MKDYIVNSSYKTEILYHVIFSTKYRRKCLTDIREDVVDSFKYAEKISRIKIYEMEIDKDHIHFLLYLSPQYSLSQLIKRLKAISTAYLYEKQRDHLRKYYWKPKRMLWTRGAYIGTCGNGASVETIAKYIRNQG